MDDKKPTTANDGRVSFAKRAVAPAPAGTGLRGRGGKGPLAADGSPMPPAPKTVRYAAVALGVSAVGALAAAGALFGQKSWLLGTYKKSNPDPGKKGHRTLSALQHAADTAPTTSLVASIVLAIALGFAARGVLRGRSWARWTVIALWVLATFTGTFASFTYLIGVASDEPVPFKIPSFVSAAALIAAVILVSIKPSAVYFSLSKPPRPEGAPARGGLFGPRPARPAAAGARSRADKPVTPARTAATRPAREQAAERSRSKQRASTESAAKGAELARARAKASKSRRTGV